MSTYKRVHWNNEYLEAARYYFWEPQALGLGHKKGPDVVTRRLTKEIKARRKAGDEVDSLAFQLLALDAKNQLALTILKEHYLSKGEGEVAKFLQVRIDTLEKRNAARTLSSLRTREVSLNHQLNILFRLLPDNTLSSLLNALSKRDSDVEPLEGPFHLLTSDEVRANFRGKDVTQPDFLFRGTNAMVGIEMKLGASCTLQQVQKYVMAFLFEELATKRQLPHGAFVILHKGEKPKWEKLQISNVEDLRKELDGIAFPNKTTKGGLSLVEHHERLEEILRNVSLAFVNYSQFAEELNVFAAPFRGKDGVGETLVKLVDGICAEFKETGAI
jgi:hypothetical protein